MRKKSRLTITLPKDLLVKVDSKVDGSIIRNRSHAIESLIKQSFKNPIETALILAGNTKTKTNPCLREIKNKPVIIHTIENIIDAGIQNIVICAGIDNQIIKDEIAKWPLQDLTFHFTPESSPLGTGGVIKKSASKILGDDFIVIHGDIITALNLDSFISFHTQESTLATIAVKPRKNEQSYGKVIIEGNQITNFLNEFDVVGIDMINAGIYLFNKKIFKYISGNKSKLEKDTFPLLAIQGQLTAFIFQGFWYDISNEKNYKSAIERLKRE